MRITHEALVQNSLKRLHSRLAQYEETQARMASGKRVSVPSDDPARASRIFTVRGEMRSRAQEVRNAEEATGWLNASDAALQSMSDRIQRVRNLALQAANPLSSSDRSAIAAEIRSIRDSLEGVANSTYAGRPLFAGHAGGAAVTKVAGVWTYTGDAGTVERRIADGEYVQINVNADTVFGFSAGGTDTLTALDDLADAIAAGDQAGVQTGIGEMDGALARVTDTLSTVGAQSNRVEAARVRAEDSILVLRAELASVEDVDIAEAMMELKTQEVAYEMTLQALGRALPPSLASFLR